MTPRKRLLLRSVLDRDRRRSTCGLSGISPPALCPFEARIDPQTRTSGLLVETDAGTGCQYIVTPWGGIVARTGPDGRQLCGPPQHPVSVCAIRPRPEG